MMKPKIFLHVGTYLPGYRGGGPTQSVKNLVEALSDKYKFYIFTVNHDFGIKKPYTSVKTDEWNEYEGVTIFYSSEQKKRKNLKDILTAQKFSLVFLNSFFSTDTIEVLLLKKRLNLNTPIILMPRGELSEGALNIKRLKKMVYLKFAKKTKLLKGIHYLCTAEDEYEQVQKLLNTDKLDKTSNIPNTVKRITLDTKEKNKLKTVFLSRITPKKNLDYALKNLENCKENIEFHIYGTLEDIKYWGKCKEIISNLPSNIIVKYKGELSNNEVITTLSNYDLFYFPTKSENYGHVISEALQASIPVLISDQTPWKNLEEKNWGWEFPLEHNEMFSEKLDELSVLEKTQYNNWKKSIFNDFQIQSRVERASSKYIKVINSIISN